MLQVTVTERLLVIAVILLLAVYCFYWAALRETESSTLTTLVVKRLRAVKVQDNEHLPGPETPCSFQTFRAIARQRADGYIPGSGTWARNGTRIEHFRPSFCRLTHGAWIPEDDLATCLRRDRIHYIAMVADSNGRGYLFNLHRLLGEAPRSTARRRRRRINCGPIYRHVGLKYDSYRSADVVVKHRCPCGGYCTLEFTEDTRDVHCDVQQVRCNVDDDFDVVLEYITAWFTIDPLSLIHI